MNYATLLQKQLQLYTEEGGDEHCSPGVDDDDVQPGDGVVIGFSLLTIEQTLVHMTVLGGHILNNVVKDNHLNLIVGLEQVHDHHDMAISITPNVE